MRGESDSIHMNLNPSNGYYRFTGLLTLDRVDSEVWICDSTWSDGNFTRTIAKINIWPKLTNIYKTINM